MDSSPVQYPDTMRDERYYAFDQLKSHGAFGTPIENCYICDSRRVLSEAIENWLVQIPDSVDHAKTWPVQQWRERMGI